MQPKLNTAQASSEGADYVVRQERALAIALVALALGVAANSILGPVGLGLMRYRTSATTLNQLLGSDAAALFVVVPITVAAAVLAFRRHPVGAVVCSWNRGVRPVHVRTGDHRPGVLAPAGKRRSVLSTSSDHFHRRGGGRGSGLAPRPRLRHPLRPSWNGLLL